MTPDVPLSPADLHRDTAEHWQRLAQSSPADLHGRLALVQSLVQARLDVTDPDVLLVLRAAQGWRIEDLAAGER